MFNMHIRNYRVSNEPKQFFSVLAWAGKGYDPTKLTPENFLKFYKKYFNSLKEVRGEYYVQGEVMSFKPYNLTIQNLPFKNAHKVRELVTPVTLLREKDKFDAKLEEFSKVAMDFWHYYQLETYNDNNRLVFNMNQSDFNYLVKSIEDLYKVSKPVFTFFNSIFRLFKLKFENKWQKPLIWSTVNYKSKPYKINLIKNKKSV